MNSLNEEEFRLARRHAPILRLDRREPFLPTRVAVFSEPAESPSFPRTVTIPPGADFVLEFAIWWDWDIQHLYELEHVWVAVERGGRWLQLRRPGTWYACTVGAGAMGLLVKDMFIEALTPREELDRVIRRHLRRFAFVPTFRFFKEVKLPPEAFTDWETLKTYIPERVKAVLVELLGRRKPTKDEKDENGLRRRRHRAFG